MLSCMITGCALVSGDRWVAGDLFDAGDHWVLHGNVDARSGAHRAEPAWLSMPTHYRKVLCPDRWWERRGVFVIPKSSANLNQAALDYVKGASEGL